jgi:hypothetical protein
MSETISREKRPIASLLSFSRFVKFLVRPAFWLDLERHHYWLSKHVGRKLAEG